MLGLDPRARQHLRRAADPPDPQRHARRRHPRRVVEGEAWPGQHEINFRYSHALETADNHVVYKNGAKEIAHLNGCSLTFMAKPDHAWVGSSCHVHASLWRDGENTFSGESETFRRLRTEQRLFDQVVTCYERERLFERG